ncbi:NitT/TauT family transport system substrate-binding protein [Rhizobium sp. BK376]|nr:NitT/TauT family transport system substrate-binding protein [Rhizobium sp. BK376]
MGWWLPAKVPQGTGRRFLFGLNAVVVAALLLMHASTTRAQTLDVSLMIGGMEKQIYLPAVLAERLGYFSNEGLNVHLLSEPAGVEATDEMLAGAVQGVVGFYDHTIDLQGLGKYTESVVQFSSVPGEAEMVSDRVPDAKTMAALKGMRLGITDLGSSTDFLTEYLLGKSGLSLDTVSLDPIGAGDILISAMKRNRIQAAMTTEPTISRLIELKLAHVMIDMRNQAGTENALGGVYPASCLYIQTSWIESHPDAVQKLANALVHALQFISRHSAEEIASHLPHDFFAGDKELYVKALEAGKAMFTPDGRMPEGGPQRVLSVLSQFNDNVRGKQIDLNRTFTNRFVDQVTLNQ